MEKKVNFGIDGKDIQYKSLVKIPIDIEIEFPIGKEKDTITENGKEVIVEKYPFGLISNKIKIKGSVGINPIDVWSKLIYEMCPSSEKASAISRKIESALSVINKENINEIMTTIIAVIASQSAQESEGEYTCSECKNPVGKNDSICPKCGINFDDEEIEENEVEEDSDDEEDYDEKEETIIPEVVPTPPEKKE